MFVQHKRVHFFIKKDFIILLHNTHQIQLKMKKLLFVLLTTMFSLSTNAQKADSLIYEQLKLTDIKTRNMAGTAVTMTLIGSLAITAGIIIDKKQSATINPIAGTVVAEVGVCLFSIGVPLWIIQVSKMNAIEIEMMRYKGYSQGSGVGLKIRF
jgi:hypothetical protein